MEKLLSPCVPLFNLCAWRGAGRFRRPSALPSPARTMRTRNSNCC